MHSVDRYNLQELNKYVEQSKFTVEKHPKANIFIYGYNDHKPGNLIGWDSINKTLRGVILDSEGKVLSRPFPKFFSFRNYVTKNRIAMTEGETARLPDCNYKIYEKVDGSMATLYWVKGKPYLASQRSFSSPNAIKASEILHSKYNHLFTKLRKDVTYIFEAIYPNTRVMVNYDKREDLILLGMIDTKTGKDLPIKNIGFPIAKDYTNEYGDIKDFNELVNLNLPNMEGFVLRYDNGFRVKIKFPWFNETHTLISKIIGHSKVVYECKEKLAELLSFPEKKVSNILIWEFVKENKPLEKILCKVDNEYYTFGFELWLGEIVAELRGKKEELIDIFPNMPEEELWNKIKPSEIKYFDIASRRVHPKYCTPMWNLINRVKEGYL